MTAISMVVSLGAEIRLREKLGKKRTLVRVRSGVNFTMPMEEATIVSPFGRFTVITFGLKEDRESNKHISEQTWSVAPESMIQVLCECFWTKKQKSYLKEYQRLY